MDRLHILLVTGGDGRSALVSTLREAGHLVVTARPDEAAAALGEPGFDTLLVDLALPGLALAPLRQALAPGAPVPPDSLADAERRHIAHVLEHTGGNRRKAAQLLGISRSTLLHKIRRYGLEPVLKSGAAIADN